MSKPDSTWVNLSSFAWAKGSRPGPYDGWSEFSKSFDKAEAERAAQQAVEREANARLLFESKHVKSEVDALFATDASVNRSKTRSPMSS